MGYGDREAAVISAWRGREKEEEVSKEIDLPGDAEITGDFIKSGYVYIRYLSQTLVGFDKPAKEYTSQGVKIPKGYRYKTWMRDLRYGSRGRAHLHVTLYFGLLKVEEQDGE